MRSVALSRLASISALVPTIWATGCVPEWKPDEDAAMDGSGDAQECDALPPPADPFSPIENETGYDHRGGISLDSGVVHHEAYLEKGPERWTMLSFQDFRGQGATRAPGTLHDLSDPYVAGHSPNYQDCEVCVLFLEGCPFDSLGGCERQFLAVGGTVRFDDFEKADSWSLDTLASLALTFEDLRFEEVAIDTVTFESGPACPSRSCVDTRDDPDPECFVVPGYSFSWVSPD